ncbi:galactosyl transferase GMA12/MNN10 family-domain-containing protein [Lipomyces oligophaga]|uniref:galactosyl transferase GMA12/MNN10 family-domain-containing protein n=1 Tax=Lipomyces oligophaga TaxID=45792 RepID=UPI0034CD85CD
MHYSIPSRAGDQAMPGMPAFKAKARASSLRTSYGPSIFSQIRMAIQDLLFAYGADSPTSSNIGSSSSSTAFEKRRKNGRRVALVIIIIVALLLLSLIITIFYAIFESFSGGSGSDSGPDFVLVLGLDYKNYKIDYLNKVIENRKEYADVHGYKLYMRDLDEFASLVSDPTRNEYKKLPVIRSAMQEYPHAKYFWYLDQNAIIMNPMLKLDEHITELKRLGSLVLRDVPVVPPDSTIRTYKHVPVERMKFIISQDHEGFQTGSFILKNEEYSKYVVDSWFDKLYQEFNFEKRDRGALEHIAQWHPTILSKMAIIPQRIFNSYPNGVGESLYQEGDFVANLFGCDAPERSCTREFDRLWENRDRVITAK